MGMKHMGAETVTMTHNEPQGNRLGLTHSMRGLGDHEITCGSARNH